ncbi:hypothetical protein [Nonomuraea rubra]|uniref:Integrase n=1 Tax=Nonomuraea rubra TaxID=46180 RepID=A0A7X0TX28_9ACTN|nr:hypothetical protein [Nonomuraea rubra]MBB6547021.1 integrase [Nonomuraea rubra]
MAVWTEQQLATFLASIAQNRLYAAWWLAALRHLQRGEPGGLCWTDIDLRAAEVTVPQQRVHADGQVVVGPRPVFHASGACLFVHDIAIPGDLHELEDSCQVA